MVVTNVIMNSVKASSLTELETNFTHIAVGSGTTTPTVSDTALVSEDLREPILGSAIKTTNDLTVEMFIDLTENNGNTIAEAGVFNAASGPTMYARNLVLSIAKNNLTEVFIVFITTVKVQNA